MVVRFLTTDDMDEIFEFQRRELQGNSRSSFMPNSAWRRSVFDNSVIVSIDDQGGIEGFSKLRQGDNELRLVYFRAAREKRGQGIGEKLLAEVVKMADEQGKPVTLSVSPNNETAIALYTKFGFAVDRSVDEDPDMAGLSTYLLRKPSSDFSL